MGKENDKNFMTGRVRRGKDSYEGYYDLLISIIPCN